MTTLRRELRKKNESIVTEFISNSPAITDVTGDIKIKERERARFCDLLTDAALELRGLKQTDDSPGEYRTGEWTHGDPTEYPERQWEWARLMRDELGFVLPNKPKKHSEKSQYSFWIMSFDDMINAAGEIGTDALKEVVKEFKEYGRKNGGVFPFNVAGPQSLVGVVRSKAAELRSRGVAVEQPKAQDGSFYG